MTVVRIAGRIVTSSTTVVNTATAIPSTAAVGRIHIIVKNNGASNVYLGNSSVTSSNGLPLEPGDVIAIDLKEEVVLYGITSSGSSDVRTLEGI